MSRKIAMIGAGSVVFCKTLIADILATFHAESLGAVHQLGDRVGQRPRIERGLASPEALLSPMHDLLEIPSCRGGNTDSPA